MILVDLALDKQKNSTRYARSVDLKIDWSKKNCERPGDRVAMVLATVAGCFAASATVASCADKSCWGRWSADRRKENVNILRAVSPKLGEATTRGSHLACIRNGGHPPPTWSRFSANKGQGFPIANAVLKQTGGDGEVIAFGIRGFPSSKK